MITALDSSVLLDVILEDPKHRDASLDALKAARQRGSLIACPIVWAEVRAVLKAPGTMSDLFEAAGIAFDPFDRPAADLAGDLWREYRRRGGRRERLLPDFLVGAHAKLRAGRLLTRDRGFYRGHFKGLTIIDPT